jgi:hypothetical protein
MYAPVSSRERSFFTSSGRSSERKRMSLSTSPKRIWKVNSCSFQDPMRVGCPSVKRYIHSSKVLRVVSRSSGYVLRMAANRVLRFPSGERACSVARRRNSSTHAVLFPEPNGPTASRAGWSEPRNRPSVGGTLQFTTP